MSETIDYVLVGGFAAGYAARAIRERDKEGTIVLIGQESHPPYDRPPLSKQFLTEDDWTSADTYSKPVEYYAENDISWLPGVRVTGLDRQARRLQLDNGDSVFYEKLLLATGSTPKKLELPGADLNGVYYLRDLEDAEAIRAAMQAGQRVVVIGAGYMGLEVTSDCVQRGLETVNVEQGGGPWGKFASEPLQQFLTEYFQSRGVTFHFNEEVAALQGEDRDGEGRVTTAVTQSGRKIEADFVVACLGVSLNTRLAREAGLEVDARQGVIVDEYLKTSDPRIWAAGDIAYFKDIALNKRWHAEHYLNAQWQGETVGALMAGGEQPYDKLAYFFSDFLDLHMILRGDPEAGKHFAVLGNLEKANFVELYADEAGQLCMGVAISRDESQLDAVSDKLEELIRQGTAAAGLSAADCELDTT